MNSVAIVAKKEILDGLRDSRSVIAAFFYALMGLMSSGLSDHRKECHPIRRTKPPLSLLLWFVGITAFMIAVAHYA